jgi:hypothetical protein
MIAIPLATPASAQATRTWISGVGDDANPCSRTAPCKTFAGAISKTAAQGEINCLDPGGFGAVTITKAISLICDQTEGGVLVSGTNAIIINAGANDMVVLSGLELEGIGTGLNGIRFLAGGGLQVRNTTIHGFRSGTGYGIAFQPSSAAATLVVDNVIISHNGVGNGSGGILIQPASTNTSTTFSLNNVRVTDNGGAGLRIDLNQGGAPVVKGAVSNSVFTDDTNAIFVKAPAGNGTAAVTVSNTLVSGNTGTGIASQDVGSTVQVTGNTISDNGFGVRSLSSGVLISFGDNALANNTTNGTFTGTAVKQ